MGLSSSQARLLSITARITDNEYKSQQIANQRIKLSDISNNARKEYNDALNSNTFVYVAYNNYGGYVQTSLSPAALYEYQPSKNQYALTNTAGKVLVDNKDAKNFRETDTLAEFLKRYDCLDNSQTTEKNIRQTVSKSAEDKYKEAYDNWIGRKPPETVVTEGKPAWTERSHKNNPFYEEIMRIPGCMEGALDDDNCYMHVIDCLLGPGEHETSNGDKFVIIEGPSNYSETSPVCPEHGNYWCWNTARYTVSDALREYMQTHYCCDGTHDNEIVDIYDADGVLRKSQVETYEFHCHMPDGSPMTLYKKLVDLLWAVKDDYNVSDVGGTGGAADKTHIGYFWHFLEFDLGEADIIEHPAEPGIEKENQDYLDWLEEKPDINDFSDDFTDEPYDVIKETLTIIDPEKAQWYTNLWYRMNGYDNPEMIERLRPEIVNDRDEDTTRTDYILSLMDIEKVTNTENFEVLDKNLMGSKDWLNNALSQGWLTMEKVGKTQTSNKYELNWSSIIYTNATDITQVEDQERISLAEVKYAKTVRDIQAKDKKLQADMTKLDTEHNALLTQYQSIKSAIDKNVERSFKTFQG